MLSHLLLDCLEYPFRECHPLGFGFRLCRRLKFRQHTDVYVFACHYVTLECVLASFGCAWFSFHWLLLLDA